MPTPIFRTPAGRLTPYAFACGYIEQEERNNVRVTLWQEASTWHVRAHDFAAGARVFWDVYETLSEARKRYDKFRVSYQ
jgi:hypothetical protein